LRAVERELFGGTGVLPAAFERALVPTFFRSGFFAGFAA
jgi:hypothetical protein